MRSFEEVYKDLHVRLNKELEEARKKIIKKFKKIYLSIVFIMTIAWLMILINIESDSNVGLNIWLLLAIIIPTAITIKLKNDKDKNYTAVFKQKVIGEFVKSIDENLEYYPRTGLPETIYLQSEFEHYDAYFSEDNIIGNFNGKIIKVASVCTLVKVETYKVKALMPAFYGILGTVECSKSIGTKIKISADKGVLEDIVSQKSNIEMDSTEFEKYFDIYAENSIVAMQILTADIMSLMIEFRKQSNLKYDITINQNQIYIRFYTGKVFEPSLLKSALDYNMLKRYYNIIEFVFKIIRMLDEVIEKTDI